MPWLKIVSGAQAGRTLDLVERELVIGRLQSCGLVLPDSRVSRRHARIRQEGNGTFLDDLESSHGTFVNGERVLASRKLQHEDRIRITPIELVYYGTATPESSFLEEDDGDTHSSTIVTVQDMLANATADGENARGKLRALLELMHNVGVSLDLHQVFPQILECVFRIFPQADRAYILLASPRAVPGAEPRLNIEAMKLRSEQAQLVHPISRTIARKVISEGKAILSSDPANDPRFEASESIQGLRLRSVICAPLFGTSRKPIGMIQVDTQNAVRQFSTDDLEVLVIIANLAAQAVDHARLHETQMQFSRRERDLEIARQVQLHFLPLEVPVLPGYQLQHYYHAADGVGGDYFGYTPLPDGRLAVAMGDVAGKGIPAALLMARLCSEVRYALLSHSTTSAAVEFLNQQFSRQVGYNCFITFCICMLDHQQHRLTLVNAGHMPPLLRRAATGQVESLGMDVAGPPLGIDAGRTYGETSLDLQPGDIVLLYTDGVNESANAEGALYSMERIEQVLQGTSSAHAAQQALLEDLHRFAGDKNQDDDICVVSFSREQ